MDDALRSLRALVRQRNLPQVRRQSRRPNARDEANPTCPPADAEPGAQAAARLYAGASAGLPLALCHGGRRNRLLRRALE